MIAVDLVDPLFPDQRGAFLCAVSGLLGVLENEIDVILRPLPLYLHGKDRQSGAVSVVPALVGDARNRGAIGQRDGLFNGQRVKIRPESDFRLVRRGPIHRVKPFSPVHDLQMGMFPEKVHQVRLRPGFVIGQFRMGMELMAELYGQLIELWIHHDSYSLQHL